MSEALRPYLWLIPVLPLLASAVTFLLGPPLLRRHSHWPCVLAIVASCVLSVMVFANVYAAGHHEQEGPGRWLAITPQDAIELEPQVEAVVHYYEWIGAGRPPAVTGETAGPQLHIGFNLRADPLSAMMLVMITFIGSFIAIYSIGYMHGDPGYPRFFAEISLFVFSMTLLVLADNFVLLYAGWEGVGLCSYLLIGFWFNKPSAAHAARKAFLVTRIGDVGMFLGIMLLWLSFDYRLDYGYIFNKLEGHEIAGLPPPIAHGVLVTACLLLLCGAVGKSAQFPLHVWLPDAMEGLSPVSALIHAATMVTAGVYLVARCTPLFMRAPEAQIVVASIGGFTALFAALIALTQNDLKRILAYSTLSQLGYMFLSLGCGIMAGGPELVTFAVVAAMFHLFTHAFFKALLFLSAGSVMHAMGNVIDIRRFSGLRKLMPITHATFLCGALALAGFPLLSGFWSKDEVLDAAYKASQSSSSYAWVYLLLLVSGLVTAGLTGFYTFRAYFKTFWGPEVIPEEAGHHAHESPFVMTVPLMVLAVFAVGVGFVLGPLTLPDLQFAHFLEKAPWFPAAETGGAHDLNWGMMGLSALLALGGIGVAYVMYVKQPDLPGKLVGSAKHHQLAYQLSLDKFGIDQLYDRFLLKPLHGTTVFLRTFDLHVLDGLVDLIGHVPRLFGVLFRPVQNGLVQFYALAMVLGLTVFLLSLLRSL